MSMRVTAIKIAPAVADVNDAPYMSNEHVAEFRALLSAMLKECETESRAAMQSLLEESDRPSDDADRCDINMQKEAKRNLADRLVKRHAEIKAALLRLDGGDYGYCEETGDEIGLARLRANPLAWLCIEAATRKERLARLRAI